MTSERPRTTGRRSVRRGMVLYIVAVVIVLLTLGAFALSSLMSVQYEAAVVRGDEIQIVETANSGVDYVAAVISLTQAGSRDRPASPDTITDPFADIAYETFEFAPASPRSVTTQDLYDNPARFVGVAVVPPRPKRPRQGMARITAVAPRFEEERLAGIRYGLINESARLHLGTVLLWEEQSPGQGARSLMKLPGMTPSTADSILDWIDADKTPRASGAELEYYQRAGYPFGPRNTIPVSLEELLLVRDVTRELVFGDDEAFTYGYQRTGERREISGSLPWSLLLTTLSAEKLVDPLTGYGKINLNDENLDFLYEQLASRLDRTTADFVLHYRKGLAADGTATPRRIACPIDLLDAEVYRSGDTETTGAAGTQGTKGGAGAGTATSTTTTSAAKPVKMDCPFSLDSADAENRFLALLDAATEDERIVVTGRVNINEAPRCVLEAIPEMEEQAVTQILTRRGQGSQGGQGLSGNQRVSSVQGGSPTDGRLRHPCWLLAEKIVDRDTMIRLWPWITTGGDVWRTQIVAFYDGEGPVNRLEAVLDSTVKPPRLVFRKNLTLYGAGFPKPLLQGRNEGGLR